MPHPSATILIADDEASIRWVLARALADLGYRTIEAADGSAALDCLLSGRCDVALVDIKMPGCDGLTLLEHARHRGLTTPVIIMTAQTTMRNAIEAMKQGAFDYVTKPFDIEAIGALVQRALEAQRQARNLQRLEHEMRRRFELGVEIVGHSAPMQEVYKRIGRVAQSDVTVLIQGESGTGKELIAKAIHYHSPRWAGPFVPLNCSAVPRDLLESELFGYEKGAFTGATERRIGKFEAAAGGTLLLDEVGDMPLDLQAKVLRVLQEREFTRVGGNEVIRADCRILAATNRDLSRLVKQGAFREDLYFRLNVVPIRVCPLRERREDIPELVGYFLQKINAELGIRVSGIAPEAMELLLDYAWPGNVRELENALVRAAVLAPGRLLLPGDFALPLPASPPTPLGRDAALEDLVRCKLLEWLEREQKIAEGRLYDAFLERVERPLLEVVLERTGGNQLKAAAILGINRNTLRKKITQLKIPLKRIAGDNR